MGETLLLPGHLQQQISRCWVHPSGALTQPREGFPRLWIDAEAMQQPQTQLQRIRTPSPLQPAEHNNSKCH